MIVQEEELLNTVRGLVEPENYFKGIDWESLLLPRNILCFSRKHQTPETEGWGGISATSGRFDQHSRFVLLLALEGPGRVGVETDVWRFAPGEGILMFPHQAHYYMDLAKSFCWLFVTFEIDSDGQGALEGLRDRPRAMTDACRAQLGKFLSSYQKGSTASRALEASVHLGHVLEEFAAGSPLDAIIAPAGTVAKVREFVFGHLGADLSVDAIATEIGCSGSYLREKFREEAGISLGHFVRSVRLVRSTHLLRQGGTGVGEIAQECGFGSFTTFSRAFSQVYGMSPSDYRKSVRQGAGGTVS